MYLVFSTFTSRPTSLLASVKVSPFLNVDRFCVLEFLAADPEVPGSIPGDTIFSD
jgi:hypothetical protein